MSKVNKLTTALIWLLRLLELAFAVILLGATGYLARQARHTHRGATRRIIVPLIIVRFLLSLEARMEILTSKPSPQSPSSKSSSSP